MSVVEATEYCVLLIMHSCTYCACVYTCSRVYKCTMHVCCMLVAVLSDYWRYIERFSR